MPDMTDATPTIEEMAERIVALVRDDLCRPFEADKPDPFLTRGTARKVATELTSSFSPLIEAAREVIVQLDKGYANLAIYKLGAVRDALSTFPAPADPDEAFIEEILSQIPASNDAAKRDTPVRDPWFPKPWRVEEDWTAEVTASNGEVVCKLPLQRIGEARSIAAAVNTFPAPGSQWRPRETAPDTDDPILGYSPIAGDPNEYEEAGNYAITSGSWLHQGGWGACILWLPIAPPPSIKMAEHPNPGSPEAVERGCTCPVIDNHHGEGIPYRGRREWWISGGCPLHDASPDPEHKDGR